MTASSSREKIPTIGLSVVHELKEEVVLDVVFVHGFTGHPVKTWTCKGLERPGSTSEPQLFPPSKARKLNIFSKPRDHAQPSSVAVDVPVYWPKDLLPTTLPRSRVLTFGYDTHVRHRHFGPALNKSTIYDMAKGFMTELEAMRRSAASRPLLFIAHSLGGIMVKEVLRQAYNNRNHHLQFKRIFDSTVGIMFFGTPHRGSDPRGLVVGTIERLAKGVGFQANQHVVNTLLPDSECRQLRDEFNLVLQEQNYIIYSFQEGVLFPGLGRKVVENDSSYLNFPKTETTVPIWKDHREMCRFPSLNDTEYRKVEAALAHIAEQVSKIQSTSNVKSPAPSPDEQALPNATSLDDQSIQTLLDSLKFEQIDSRQESIRVAHKNTCVWITKTRKYNDWLDINKMQTHHGFLWMRGKAGSGKSTLIKSTLRSFQRAKRNSGTTVIYFFFNARGAELEKTTTGMYRSLLLQLLETLQKKMPHFQKAVFESAAIETWNVREGREWSVAILEELFENAILSIGQEEVTCFIDALDECDDDQVEPMIRLFERIGEQAVSKGLRFRIFFSSRPYPDISLDTCLNLLLDGQGGHVRDIKTYIQNELKVGDQQTKDHLLERASGIFMWAVLVVDILNKEKRKGTPSHLVTKKLKMIPQDLWELFKSILTRDQDDKDHLLLCIQWLLFTQTPLVPEQFYYAILSGLECDDEIDSDHGLHSSALLSGLVTDDDSDSGGGSHSSNKRTETPGDAATARLLAVQRFIRNTSKGLAEVTQSKKAPVVQFIHESVRDFLLKEDKKGLRVVWPELDDNFEAQSHETLKRCCFKYLQREIPTNLGVDLERELPKASSKEGSALREKAVKNFPFLEYATRNILGHAEYAQMGAVPQTGFLEDDFDLRTWLLLRNVLEKHETRRYNYTYTASLLYVLAELNLPALIRVCLHTLDAAAILATEQERYGSPLLAAIVFKSQGTIEAFVDHLATLQQIPASTVDEWRSETRKIPSVSSNFRFSNKRDLFSYLVEIGDVALVHLIYKIPSHEVDLDKNDKDGRTPLSHAAGKGHAAIVKFLCQEGANISSTDHYGWTPLSRAAANGHTAIVKFLCQEGANINITDRDGRTLLSHAAENGHTDILRLLHMKGADLNSRDAHKMTPVMYAAQKGYTDAFELLVSGGSDLQARDDKGTTLLMFAVEGGNQEIVKLLLEKGASVKAVDQQGESAMAYTKKQSTSLDLSRPIELTCLDSPHWTDDGGRSPIYFAMQQLDSDAMELLLRTEKVGANSKDNNGRTPLSHAVCNSTNINIVRLLIDNGKAEVNSKDNNGRTPLSHAVCNPKNIDIVRLLIDSGKVEVDSKDNNGRTPLSHAVCSFFNIDIVRLLIDSGKVEVDSKDNDGRTPLSHAASDGSMEIVTLLLNTKNVDINSRDSGWRTPLSWAAGSGKANNVETLLAFDVVEVDTRDMHGRTPLMHALYAMLSDTPSYQHNFLLETVAHILGTNRVNVDLVDNTDQTPLDLAAAVDKRHLASDFGNVWRLGRSNSVVVVLKSYKEGRFKGLSDSEPSGAWLE
ncbi:ankyrin repeat-containing domain protein [Triangularia setosa]|uniref:Ankyrin repeat-containing domain protein n=1 Tax=Triangularia setosa TaxID=2587417 RepID=A0AAN6WE42_9PEZI|nr:ankyrin repeat-containing domain protein [Podospora setosa]